MCVYDLNMKKQVIFHLADLVRKEAKKATDPIYGRDIMSTSSSANKRSQDQKKSEAHRNFAVKTNTRSFYMYDNSATQMKPVFKHCTFSNGAHSLDMCLSITILSLKDRFLKTNGLCFAC